MALGLILLVAAVLRLSYAAVDLNANREGFVDEMYNVGNVRAILETRTLRPVTAFYGELSYLPQAALLLAVEALAGGEEAPFTVLGRERSEVPTVRWDAARRTFSYERHRLFDLSPWAYLVVRLFSCFYGVVAIWFLWDIGRRLFSPVVGLGAALLLTALPVHVHMSGIFKPDALVLLALLLALRKTLDVIDAPSLGNYLWVGLWVGVATASKVNAAVGAVPLIVVSLPLVSRDPRVWLRLAFSGALAIGIFLTLNPSVEDVLHALEANREVYGNIHPLMRARGESSRLVGLWNAPWMQLDPRYFGVLVGGLGLVGLGAWLMELVRRRRRGREALELAALVSLPLAYWVLIATVLRADVSIPGSPLWSLYLPMTPVVCLAATWLLARLAGRLSSLRVYLVATSLSVVVLGWTMVRGPLTLHRLNTSRTSVALAEWLVQTRFPHLDQLLVCSELPGELKLEKRGEAPAYLRASELAALDAATLSGCDIEVYSDGLLTGRRQRDWVESRSHQYPETRLVRYPPSLFRRRGPGVAVVLHPWSAPGRVSAELQPGSSTGEFVGFIDAPAGAVGSISVWFGFQRPESVDVELMAGSERLALYPSTGGQSHRLSSGRFVVPENGRFTLRLPEWAADQEIALRAFRWTPPEEGASAGL